jgi:hypothetical protein
MERMEQSMQPTYTQDQVQAFYTLYLAHDPESHARMNGPKAAKKYTKVHHAPGIGEIINHLVGRRTIAVPLVGPHGLCHHAALDVDAGGPPALRRLLAAAQAQGYTAYAITSDTDEHQGGHVWLHFDQAAAPERTRLLADQLAQVAGVDAETYPTRKALRLPLGVHQWTGKRGHLLLQDGQQLDLDTHTDAVAQALATIAALPLNQTSALPDVPRRAPTALHAHHMARGAANDTITRYNGQTDLVALLESYGGRIAERYSNGGALLHCPCGRHSHGDRRPSLEVQPARSARYGRMVAVGHAAHCLFYTERRQVMDVFGVYCKLEGLTTREALYRLNPCRLARPPRRRNEPDPDERNEPPNESTPEPNASRTDTTAQQQARVDEVHALHAELRARAATDTALGPTAQRVLDALLVIANDRDWCRPSKPRLAAMLGVSNRTVQRGLVELEQRGYLRTDEHTTCDGTVYRGGYSTPLRHFLRETRDEAASSTMSPVSKDTRSLQAPVSDQACEAPPVSAGVDGSEASYNPAEDWTLRRDRPAPQRTWTSSMRPKEAAVWQRMREARRTWGNRADDVPHAPAARPHESTTDVHAATPTPEPSVSRTFIRPSSTAQHAGPQVRPHPPSDPQRRKEYAKLLGKAKRVERSSPRQAAYLRARARQLEELTISAPAPRHEEVVLGQVDCPAMWRTPQAQGLVPVQLVLGAPRPAMGTPHGAIGGASQASRRGDTEEQCLTLHAYQRAQDRAPGAHNWATAQRALGAPVLQDAPFEVKEMPIYYPSILPHISPLNEGECI